MLDSNRTNGKLLSGNMLSPSIDWYEAKEDFACYQNCMACTTKQCNKCTDEEGCHLYE